MKETNEKHSEASSVVPLIPPSRKDSPPSQTALKSPAPKKHISVNDPFPDEDRPDPEPYRLIIRMQALEDPARPDGYLSGSDPHPVSPKRKERPKNKHGSSHGENSPRVSPKSPKSPNILSPKSQDGSSLGENSPRVLPKSPKSQNMRPPKSPRYPRSPHQTLSDRSKSDKGVHRTDGILTPVKNVSKDNHRSLRVDEWLNSPGKSQRRSWRVKQVREVCG